MKALFGAQVAHDDGRVRSECVPGLRIHPGVDPGAADQAFFPAHAGAQQHFRAARKQLEHLAIFDFERPRDHRRRPLEHLLNVALAQRELAQARHRLLLARAGEQARFGAFARRDVEGEAARMDEPAVLEQHAGIDQHVAQRAVLAAHARGVFVQPLSAGEPREDVVDHRPVGMELGDVAADVLLDSVAEHLQLGAVGPQDDAVGSDPMQADRRGLEEVRQLLLAPAQPLLGAPALGYVVEDVDRADDPARGVADRIDVDHGHEPRSVRALDDGLLVAERLALAQRLGHRRLLRRHERSIQRKDLVARAEAFAGLANGGRASPQLHRVLVVVRDTAARRLAGVDRRGHQAEDAAIALLARAQGLLRLPALGDVAAHADDPQRRAVRVAKQLAAALDPAHAAVRPHDAVLEVMLTALQRPADATLHFGPVFGMDVALIGLERARERARREPVDRFELGDQVTRCVGICHSQEPMPPASSARRSRCSLSRNPAAASRRICASRSSASTRTSSSRPLKGLVR